MPNATDAAWGLFVLGPFAAVIYFCSIQPRIQHWRNARAAERQAMEWRSSWDHRATVRAPQAGFQKDSDGR